MTETSDCCVQLNVVVVNTTVEFCCTLNVLVVTETSTVECSVVVECISCDRTLTVVFCCS